MKAFGTRSVSSNLPYLACLIYCSLAAANPLCTVEPVAPGDRVIGTFKNTTVIEKEGRQFLRTCVEDKRRRIEPTGSDRTNYHGAPNGSTYHLSSTVSDSLDKRIAEYEISARRISQLVAAERVLVAESLLFKIEADMLMLRNEANSKAIKDSGTDVAESNFRMALALEQESLRRGIMRPGDISYQFVNGRAALKNALTLKDQLEKQNLASNVKHQKLTLLRDISMRWLRGNQ